MSIFDQIKFVDRLRSHIPLLKKTGDDSWVGRCIFCGDSKKDLKKTRGYIYSTGKSLRFYCHNCGKSLSFDNFLKQVAPNIYEEYLVDTFEGEGKKSSLDKPLKPKKKILQKRHIINLPTISSLSEKHKSYIYLKDRKIPVSKFSELFFTENFREFVKGLDLTKEKDFPADERIVIPFYDKQKRLLGVSGRSLEKKPFVRYATFKLKKDNPKIYGLDTVDQSKTVYVLEGPIDSFFIDNSVATMDANLLSARSYIEGEMVFVFDNQPRNKSVLKNMEKVVESGEKIFIPSGRNKEKDINDFVLAGWSKDDIMHMINERVFSGLDAELEFNEWKKL